MQEGGKDRGTNKGNKMKIAKNKKRVNKSENEGKIRSERQWKRVEEIGRHT
jgi:hypothetical protein